MRRAVTGLAVHGRLFLFGDADADFLTFRLLGLGLTSLRLRLPGALTIISVCFGTHPTHPSLPAAPSCSCSGCISRMQPWHLRMLLKVLRRSTWTRRRNRWMCPVSLDGGKCEECRVSAVHQAERSSRERFNLDRYTILVNCNVNQLSVVSDSSSRLWLVKPASKHPPSRGILYIALAILEQLSCRRCDRAR